MKDQSFGVIPIFKRGKERLFLLIQHRAGHWAFPKGHPKAGENDCQAARREFEEETGIVRYSVREDVSFTESYVIKGNPPVEKTVKYFPAFVENLSVRISENEISDYAWLRFEEAKRQATYEECRRLLDGVAAYLQKIS